MQQNDIRAEEKAIPDQRVTPMLTQTTPNRPVKFAPQGAERLPWEAQRPSHVVE
ncbi:hypothetical protein S101447_02440 [Acetobacter ascendens]|uniref:Uncharacterized protein n=1 Tax=Acetobacter ascendens TaxID=481146 RepID=A0A1Y0V720_9PROT|nr:hypothetical protein S101447_02440 [Acetobacter ascendens]